MLFIAFTAAIALVLTGCGNYKTVEDGETVKDDKTVEDYLSIADYQKAYDTASTDDEKDLVKAENTFAYLYSRFKADVFGGEEVSFTLQSAWFADGKELMEFFSGYHYYLVKISIEDTTDAYILYNYNLEEGGFANLLNITALALENTEELEAISAAQALIIQSILNSDKSLALESQSVYRINTLMENNGLDGVSLDDSMRFSK